MEGNDAGNKAYIQWAGHLTQSFDTGLVWGACSTHDIPRPVIPTCNGLDCYNWMRRNRTQPAIWTEHWSAEAWTWHWGSHLPHNSAENMAYAAAYWYAEGGAYMSYYMVFSISHLLTALLFNATHVLISQLVSFVAYRSGPAAPR